MRKNLINVISLVLVLAALGFMSRTSYAASSGVVNINAASAQQLQYLKGIGAKKAKAIIEFRSNAPFQSVDELVKVKGIGKKLVNKLRPQLSVKGQTTLRPPKNKKRGHSKKSH